MGNKTSVGRYEGARASDVQDSGGVENFTAQTTVITPTSGKKFRTKRVRVVATIRTALGASEGFLLALCDNVATAPIAPIGIFADSAAAGTVVEATIDLGEGYLSSAADNPIKLFNTGTALSTGRLNIFTEIRGTEE